MVEEWTLVTQVDESRKLTSASEDIFPSDIEVPKEVKVARVRLYIAPAADTVIYLVI